MARPPGIVAEVEASPGHAPVPVAAIPSVEIGPARPSPIPGPTLDPQRPTHMAIVVATVASLVRRVLIFTTRGRTAAETSGVGPRTAAVAADPVLVEERDTVP